MVPPVLVPRKSIYIAETLYLALGFSRNWTPTAQADVTALPHKRVSAAGTRDVLLHA